MDTDASRTPSTAHLPVSTLPVPLATWLAWPTSASCVAWVMAGENPCPPVGTSHVHHRGVPLSAYGEDLMSAHTAPHRPPSLGNSTPSDSRYAKAPRRLSTADLAAATGIGTPRAVLYWLRRLEESGQLEPTSPRRKSPACQPLAAPASPGGLRSVVTAMRHAPAVGGGVRGILPSAGCWTLLRGSGRGGT